MSERWNRIQELEKIDYSAHPLTKTLRLVPNILSPLQWNVFREALQIDPDTAHHAVGAFYLLRQVLDNHLFLPYKEYIGPEDELSRAILFHDMGKAGVAETMEESAKIVGEPGSEAAKIVQSLHPWIGGKLADSCGMSDPVINIIFGHHEGPGSQRSYPRQILDRPFEDTTISKEIVQAVERAEACIGIRPYHGDAQNNDPRVRLMNVREMLSDMLRPWAIAPIFSSLVQATEFCQNMTTILCEKAETMLWTPGLYDSRIFPFWQNEFAPDANRNNWELPKMIDDVRRSYPDRLAFLSETS